MGIRTLLRSIAKARLAEIGVDHINKRMRYYWRSILNGDLAKEYQKKKLNKKRKVFLDKLRHSPMNRKNERRS